MEYQPTKTTQASRKQYRVSYDQAAVYAVLDEALYCTVSYAVNQQVLSIPTMHARLENYLYLHGSAKSHFLLSLPRDQKACLSVTLLDGLVLARAAFNHSMNYRSVILFAPPEEVTEEAEKTEALRAMINRSRPGRWEENIRKPSLGELTATQVLRFAIEEVSLKQRQGPPQDSETDRQIDVWTGCIPLELRALPAVPNEVKSGAV